MAHQLVKKELHRGHRYHGSTLVRDSREARAHNALGIGRLLFRRTRGRGRAEPASGSCLRESARKTRTCLSPSLDNGKYHVLFRSQRGNDTNCETYPPINVH